jgi:Kef-type K+ transport system membrane component KefB
MMSLIAALPTELPVTDPVLIFAIVMLILLIAPILIKLLRVPALIGLIAAGTVFGPNVLGVLDRDPTIVLLGTVGLLYIMFLAGLEVDLNEFAKAKVASGFYGILTFAIPQAGGLGIGLLLGYSLPASILLGSILASHTPIPYPVASRLKIHKTPSATMTMGGTIITNFLGLLVLAVIAGSAGGEINQEFWINLLVPLTIYGLVVFFGLPRLGRWFFSKVDPEATAEYVFVMAALFVCSYGAVVAGVEAIIGAFLAGLLLNRLIPESSTLMNRVNFVGNALFIPFFLLSVGMLVDPMVLISSWKAGLLMTLALIVTKVIAAVLAKLTFKFSFDEFMVVAGLSIPQAAATLAAVMIGYEMGLYDEVALNGVIMMILVSCSLGVFMVEKYGKNVAEALKDDAPKDDSTPHRIMLPLLQEESEMTLELAFALRGSSGEEALYPVTVVPDSEDDESSDEVARAEKLLQQAVTYMAGADIQAIPLTRVAANVPSGIKRAAIERRISDVIMPWDGKPSEGRIFGRTIDVLLSELKPQLLIANVQHPINTTQRLVVVVAEGAEQSVGFERSVKDLKQLASQLGAMITVISTHAQLDTLESTFQSTGASVAVSCVGFDSFDLMLAAAGERADENDLTIFVLPRPNNPTWRPELAALPRRISDLMTGSYVFIFPSEVVQTKQESAQIAEVLANVRLHLGLQEPSIELVIRNILDAEFHLDHELPRRIAKILGENGQFTNVGEQGVVISAQNADFPCDVHIIATSDVPVQLSPRDNTDTRFVGLVLSCKARTQREHQERIQETIAAISHLQSVPGILKVYSPKEFVRRGGEKKESES